VKVQKLQHDAARAWGAEYRTFALRMNGKRPVAASMLDRASVHGNDVGVLE